MLWVSLALIVVFGGLAVWFHNQMFIMWKPSIYFWGSGLMFWASQTFFHKNLLRSMLGEELRCPTPSGSASTSAGWPSSR